MTDLETPLNEAERAEFALRSFVHFVVNQAGKFGDEAAAEVLDGGLRDPQWAHVERLMGGVRLEAAIGDEIDRLGEFLDFFSYTRIIRDTFCSRDCNRIGRNSASRPPTFNSSSRPPNCR
ncbi:hypothetical protein M3Y99_01328800 [Aphelenchoides fujianensis]|nr:hypothetical protein M3Y99_01328800 [Aphelenchoides fujianensis]